jgi:hypothetical protein
MTTSSVAVRPGALFAVLFAFIHLPTTSACAKGSDGVGSPDDEQVGFYLLSDVCQQETQVKLITLIKTTPPGVVDFVKRVSQTADESVATINRLQKGDPSLKTTDNPLPAFEQRVRNSIRDDKQHQLLFGTKGPDFARALLVTQIEATNYITNIAKDLAASDPDPDCARTLNRLSAKWLSLRVEAFRLLDAS